MKNSKNSPYTVGAIFKNNKDLEFKIIDKIDKDRRLIKFLISGYENTVHIANIKNGRISDNFNKVKIGDVFVTKKKYTIKIIDKVGFNYKIKFLDEYGFECISGLREIKNGSISNPYHKSVFNIGFMGDGNHKSAYNKIRNPIFETWRHMIGRCYDKKIQEKQPTYKNIVVCSEWHNFQNFAGWYEDNYPKNVENIKLHLDKDLLQLGMKNKVYSPQTCVFLPRKTNSFLTSVNSNNSYTGIHWRKESKKWQVGIGTGKDRCYLGLFDDKEDARLEYLKARKIEAEKQKDYLRSLNYLPEETIELIK